MGETRVDLLHLLEDLRDAYPDSLEETILTEIMANALDSGASLISFASEPAQNTITVVDNGSGMQRRDLARFHDIASSNKIRGQGIGFAGVGIKLGLLVCDEVLTETRRGKNHVATRWQMASRHRAPWKWTPAPGLTTNRGTAVRLKLHNPLSPLLDPGFVEDSILRHFEPLLDPAFDDFLRAHYPEGIAIHINGRHLERRRAFAPLRAPLEIRMLRKRKPSALGYLFRDESSLPEERRGLAISTHGKVIRRGWDWLGLTPTAPDRIGGLIEVPELAACLTLNKGDFIRTGARGATYLAFRKAIQQAVAKQLASWGDAQPSSEQAPPREAKPLQRDLVHLLEDLAAEFPLLSSLVERRAGGQKRLPFGAGGAPHEGRSFVAAAVTAGLIVEDAIEQTNSEPSTEGGDDHLPANKAEPFNSSDQSATTLSQSSGARRPAHYGLDIQFDERADDINLGCLIESTVWVNRAHPAYRRASVSRSLGYHIALTVALSLAPLAVEPAQQSGFVLAFLSRWGEAIDRPGRARHMKQA